MKNLFIIRHAKSDWSIDGLADIDRPLNTRGYRDAHAIGKILKEKNWNPDAMISSPAIRALSTCLIISEELQFLKSGIRIEPALYESNLQKYIDVLKTVDEASNSVAFFGHNPIVSDLCSFFAKKLIDMPTCSVVQFQVSSSKWAEASHESVSFVDLISPKMI